MVFAAASREDESDARRYIITDQADVTAGSTERTSGAAAEESPAFGTGLWNFVMHHVVDSSEDFFSASTNTWCFRSTRAAILLLIMALVCVAAVVMLGLLVSGNFGGDQERAVITTVDNNNNGFSPSTAEPHPTTQPPSYPPPDDETNIYYWEKLGDYIEGTVVNGYFGYSAAISANGSIVAGGEPGPLGDAGKVRVFLHNDDDDDDSKINQWTPLGNPIAGANPGDRLGTFVALSADGSVLAASSVPSGEAAASNPENPGYLRVFRYDAARTNDWIQVGQTVEGVAQGDEFGSSVVLSADGTIVAAGAVKNDGIHGNLTDCGHVRVFQWDGANEEWRRLGQVLDGQDARDWFGESIALSSDGMILAAGSKFHSPRSGGGGGPAGERGAGHDDDLLLGQVRVFQYDAATDTWLPRGQPLYGESSTEHFGVSVALSADASVLAVGSDWKHDTSSHHSGAGRYYSGSVRVFSFDTVDNEWRPLGHEIYGRKSFDEFGWRVALSATGNDLVVGAPYHKLTATGWTLGRVHVFRYDCSHKTSSTTNANASACWRQVGQSFVGQDNVENSEWLGWSVALSADGRTVLAGTAWHRPAVGTVKAGQVRVYRAPKATNS